MAAAFNIQALTITTPIDYTHTANNPIVGTFDTGQSAANIPTVTSFLNTLLGLGANTSTEISGVKYVTSSVDYTGIMLADSGVRVDSGDKLNVPSGYDFLVAKYDGPNAGYVAWFLGGGSATIPEFSDTIWANKQGVGYQISGYTAYKSASVPDGGATAALLGAGVIGLAVIRRKR